MIITKSAFTAEPQINIFLLESTHHVSVWQIFRALSYIHCGIGVCHRDIKPQNLLVCLC